MGIHVAWVKMKSVRCYLLCSAHRNSCMHIAALKSAQPHLKTCLSMCFRVPTAAEVEKWKESFNHMMSSESECFTPEKFHLNQIKANELVFKRLGLTLIILTNSPADA